MNKKICVDGNTAAASMAYKCSEIACIYPITPSSNMAESCDEWASNNKLNIFGNPLKVVEMQSEAGAAGAVHGSLATGSLTTTFTASQGLLLMIPNMYKIAGELLPAVFHVSARAIASHALSIFGDHSDVMACRQTGFNMLCSNNVQEAQDFALISHISALKASLPFLHFFDGFRTSHEINKIEEINDDIIKEMFPYEKLEEFRKNAHNPSHPKQTGTAENPDIFFQNREACNTYYDKVYDIVKDTMIELENKTGRHYRPFEYYGNKNAKKLIVIMGSGADVVEEMLDNTDLEKNEFGLIKVRLYRPFNAKAFCELIPNSVDTITVLDRTKEPGSLGEPLYLDVVSAINENIERKIKVLAGRYGLGSKNFTPSDVYTIYQNMLNKNKNHFTVGINDDVTNLSLKPLNFNYDSNDIFECKFYGLGSDGTVSANKNSIKIIGENTDLFVQGYFEYDSKKSGSLTVSHLRTSSKKLKCPFFVNKFNFVAIHNYGFINRYDVLDGLKNNGTVLINTSLTEDELATYLPDNFKKHLKETNCKLYIIPAQKIANEVGLKNKINVIMQSCFFKITNIISYNDAEKYMKEFATKSYSKKGDAVVNANMLAIESATKDLIEVNVDKIVNTKTLLEEKFESSDNYYKSIIKPINEKLGDYLPVSSFSASGTFPTDTAKFEKRGIGLSIPCWKSENCIQCGLCTLVCPHAAIRSKLIDSKDAENLESSFTLSNAYGANDKKFRIQVSPLDCTGCGSCANVCPARNKALVMTDDKSVLKQEEKNYEISEKLNNVQNPFNINTIKGIQFEKPYFEFNGACAGCGETPYIKLITQLFGKNMIIANATGCSSIYSGSAPTCPYSKDSNGCGPSWANSLFEDNAEFGYGMKLSIKTRQENFYRYLQDNLNEFNENYKAKVTNIINKKDNVLDSEIDEFKLETLNLFNETKNSIYENIINNFDLLGKKSIWIIGGDGWAYDIGYGGLDHVLASGENVNILVLDTEVYSNTGGQSSKSTPLGSIVKFASYGKRTPKKDLGQIAMTYKNVYVASVAMGADPNQLIKAVTEAEKYNGVSLIIAYSPCINHGFDLSNAQNEMKKAVQSGYWSLYRYNPNDTNPLHIDSIDPTMSYEEFLKGESRYSALTKKNPDLAKKLFEESKNNALERIQTLKKLANN